MALFKRPPPRASEDALALGVSVVALRLEGGARVPDGASLIVFDAGARARRIGAAKVVKLDGAAGEVAYCFHPGPYRVELTPFAAAPELGLRLDFVVDAADPRVAQQRFDLFLFSEVAARLALRDFAAVLQGALRLELGQGNLTLAPCTSPQEWNAFRAGLNQLLYTRFGITVDDCLPVDLGESVDYAATLEARARARLAAPARDAPVPAAGGVLPAAPAAISSAPPATDATRAAALQAGDSRALRRLFLELPALTSGLRLLALPSGQQLFLAHQRLLQCLDLALLAASTMPALAWAAPDRPLGARQQTRRVKGSAAAVAMLDEAWALLARFQLAAPAQLPQLLDEAERVSANLALGLELRRAVNPDLADAPDLPERPFGAHIAPQMGPPLQPPPTPKTEPVRAPQRREPT